MDVEILGRAMASLPKIAFYKIRYIGKCHLPWVHSFGKHFSLHVKGAANVKIGKELVTRGQVSLRVDQGTLTIGEKCFLNSGCSITCMDEVTIGKGCQIANHVVIVDHDHDYKKGWGAFVSKPVTIGENVWIGANCVILKGTKIGDRSVIAAGSVVSGEIPSNTLFYQKRETKIKQVSHD